jgi:hypothetical protein
MRQFLYGYPYPSPDRDAIMNAGAAIWQELQPTENECLWAWRWLKLERENAHENPSLEELKATLKNARLYILLV